MVIHKGTKNIETERLLLRRLEIEDAQEMFDHWAKDSDVTKYLTWEPHKNVDETKEILSQWMGLYDDKEYYQWGICIKETNSLVGSIGTVSHNNDNDSCEIGYCISQSVWGNGYMTEAVKAMNDYLFDEVGFHRISAMHYKENFSSGRVMVKAGMTYEGCKRGYYKNLDGAYIDCESYAVIKSDRQ
jgi:ribosomal-protein-alanine N-acetyltransferase